MIVRSTTFLNVLSPQHELSEALLPCRTNVPALSELRQVLQFNNKCETQRLE